MSSKTLRIDRGSRRFLFAVALSALCAVVASAQSNQANSIGGREHDDNILGVKIGMNVGVALESVFVNSGRQPGQEKPDAKRNEGTDKKDVRVLYKNLKVGELQIVFANGQWVKEIVLIYAAPPHSNELRLARSGFVGEAFGGERFDDRYSVGFTDDKKTEQFWWREEKAPANYRVRVGFVSKKIKEEPSAEFRTVVRKIISVTPGDEAKFLQATTAQ